MKRVLLSIYGYMLLLGFDPLKTISTLRSLPFYIRDLLKLKGQSKRSNASFPFGMPKLYLDDRFKGCGACSGQYFHQDLLVARKIYINNPKKHVDVGSRIDGFVAHLASFREIEVFDIRELQTNLTNIRFKQVDMINPNFSIYDYCDSLSCLHAIEHFGLGRYGDTVCYEGHILGLNNIYKMLKAGGILYISVPIGRQRIEFNAHRIFSVKYLLDIFKDKYSVKSFSYVNDKGNLFEDEQLTEENINTNFSCDYGLGIFELTKLGGGSI